MKIIIMKSTIKLDILLRMKYGAIINKYIIKVLFNLIELILRIKYIIGVISKIIEAKPFKLKNIEELLPNLFPE